MNDIEEKRNNNSIEAEYRAYHVEEFSGEGKKHIGKHLLHIKKQNCEKR